MFIGNLLYLNRRPPLHDLSQHANHPRHPNCYYWLSPFNYICSDLSRFQGRNRMIEPQNIVFSSKDHSSAQPLSFSMRCFISPLMPSPSIYSGSPAFQRIFPSLPPSRISPSPSLLHLAMIWSRSAPPPQAITQYTFIRQENIVSFSCSDLSYHSRLP
jgi:hypothetical protein